MLAKPTVMSQRLHPEMLLNLRLLRGRNLPNSEGSLHLQLLRGHQPPWNHNYLKALEDLYKDLRGLENKSGKNHNSKNLNSNKLGPVTTTDMEV